MTRRYQKLSLATLSEEEEEEEEEDDERGGGEGQMVVDFG